MTRAKIIAIRAIGPVTARVTVLASGGSGRVYQYTSNPDIVTTDMVFRHVDHMAELVGIDHVGFGSDYIPDITWSANAIQWCSHPSAAQSAARGGTAGTLRRPRRGCLVAGPGFPGVRLALRRGRAGEGGELPVADQLSRPHVQQGLPDLNLKVGAANVQVKRRAFPRRWSGEDPLGQVRVQHAHPGDGIADPLLRGTIKTGGQPRQKPRRAPQVL